MKVRIILLVAAFLSTGCRGCDRETRRPVATARPVTAPPSNEPPQNAPLEPSASTSEAPLPATSSAPPAAPASAAPPPASAPRKPGTIPCGPQLCGGKTPICSLIDDGYKVVGYACVASVAAAFNVPGYPVQCWSARDCPKGMHCYGSNEALCTRGGTPGSESGFRCETQADCDVPEVRRLTLKAFPGITDPKAKVVCSEPPKPGFPRACVVEIPESH